MEPNVWIKVFTIPTAKNKSCLLIWNVPFVQEDITSLMATVPPSVKMVSALVVSPLIQKMNLNVKFVLLDTT